jgi:putative colanic acid biosynthesis acetyltransferase WcaB
MNFFQFIFQDWKANKKNTKGRFVLFFFRVANYATVSRIYRFFCIPYFFFYRFVFEWVLGIEIPWKSTVGKNFRLYHGQGLVINRDAVIGQNCTIRHCTTIGNKEISEYSASGSPIIGNNVDIGCNVCIIGNIAVSSNVKIGAGSIVTKDIPGDCVIAGNPARIIKHLNI